MLECLALGKQSVTELWSSFSLSATVTVWRSPRGAEEVAASCIIIKSFWLPRQIDLCVRLKAYIRIWEGRFTARIHPSLGAILEAALAILSIPLPSNLMWHMFPLSRRSTMPVLGLPAWRRQWWKLENQPFSKGKLSHWHLFFLADTGWGLCVPVELRVT